MPPATCTSAPAGGLCDGPQILALILALRIRRCVHWGSVNITVGRAGAWTNVADEAGGGAMLEPLEDLELLSRPCPFYYTGTNARRPGALRLGRTVAMPSRAPV
jgi:hypothetical protein